LGHLRAPLNLSPFPFFSFPPQEYNQAAAPDDHKRFFFSLLPPLFFSFRFSLFVRCFLSFCGHNFWSFHHSLVRFFCDLLPSIFFGATPNAKAFFAVPRFSFFLFKAVSAQPSFVLWLRNAPRARSCRIRHALTPPPFAVAPSSQKSPYFQSLTDFAFYALERSCFVLPPQSLPFGLVLLSERHPVLLVLFPRLFKISERTTPPPPPTLCGSGFPVS